MSDIETSAARSEQNDSFTTWQTKLTSMKCKKILLLRLREFLFRSSEIQFNPSSVLASAHLLSSGDARGCHYFSAPCRRNELALSSSLCPFVRDRSSDELQILFVGNARGLFNHECRGRREELSLVF